MCANHKIMIFTCMYPIRVSVVHVHANDSCRSLLSVDEDEIESRSILARCHCNRCSDSDLSAPNQNRTTVDLMNQLKTDMIRVRRCLVLCWPDLVNVDWPMCWMVGLAMMRYCLMIKWMH